MKALQLHIDGIGLDTKISAIVATLLEHTRLRKDQLGKVEIFRRKAKVELLSLDEEELPRLLEDLEGASIQNHQPWFWVNRCLYQASQKHADAMLRALEKEQTCEERSESSIKVIQMEDWSLVVGGRLQCTLKCHDLPKHWSKGCPISLSSSANKDNASPKKAEPFTMRGLLKGFERDAVVVVLEGGSALLDELKGALILSKSETQVTHERRMEGWQRLWGSHRPHLQAYLSSGVIEDSREKELDHTASLPCKLGAHSELNEEQSSAYQSMISSSAPAVQLLHGPPGTGKTTVLRAALEALVEQGQKILVTANSNSAIDHLLAQCVDIPVCKFRLGHPARVRPHLQEHVFDEVLQSRIDEKSIKAIKKAIRELRKEMNKGGHPSTRWRELKAELRELEREMLHMEQLAREHLWKDVQIVFATNTACSTTMFGARLFDVVVVDEAAQCIEPDLWLAAMHGKRLIMAGDPEQLSAVVKSNADILSTSLMTRWMQSSFAPVHTLKQQYRMSTSICQFPSESFYQGELTSHPSVANNNLETSSPTSSFMDDVGFIFLDTAGADHSEERVDDSYLNRGQAQCVVDWITRLLKEEACTRADIAVLCPYSAQKKLLSSFEALQGIDIESIDGYQGRESKVIIYCTVRNAQELGFLKDHRRLNVAITRAQSHLCVIGDSATLAMDPHHEALVNHAEQMGSYRSIWEYMDQSN